MDFDFTTETITPDVTNVLTVGGTGALEFPIGTTSERPLSVISGALRWNTTNSDFEYFNGIDWETFGGTGTVTSVSASGSVGLTVSGSPITTSGTLTFTLDTGLQNLSTFNTTGFVVASGIDTWISRTLSGITNRISIIDGNGVLGNPAIDIASTYVGQTSITTLGTITTGTWNGTTISTARGGTGLTTIGSAFQILRVNSTGTALEYATAPGGTVTSVGLSGSGLFTITGSPITTSGTININLAPIPANTFISGPATGSPAIPTARTISLAQNDLSDVVITSPIINQVLAYDGIDWVNTGAVGANATGTVGVSPSGGGTPWTLISGNIYRADFVHNLGTTNIVVTVWDTNNNTIVIPQTTETLNNNTIRISAIGNTRTLKVVVVANGQSIVAGGSTPSSVITAYEGVNISTAATRLNFRGQAVGVTDAGAGTTNIVIGSRFSYFANSLDSPNSPDFAINALAPVTTDPTFTSLNVRTFSNTIEQGVACTVSIPTGATTLTVKIRGRAQTAPGVVSVVQPRLYYRLLPNNSAVGAWSTARELANISIPTNTNFQYSTQTISLSTLGLVAGNLYQFQFTRRVTGVIGTNLGSNFLMAELTLEFA